MTDVRILGTGAYVPERIVSNDEVAAAAGRKPGGRPGRRREGRYAAG